MKRYVFWVTLNGKAPMKVAEEGRTSIEANKLLRHVSPGAESYISGSILMELKKK